jgi:hypothetical protein
MHRMCGRWKKGAVGRLWRKAAWGGWATNVGDDNRKVDKLGRGSRK